MKSDNWQNQLPRDEDIRERVTTGSQTDSRDDKGGIPIVIDAYGVKVHLESHPGEEEAPPANWSQVLERLKGHLMRLAVAPTALLVTVFEGATRLISGISRIPNVLARAVAAAHSEADKKENDHQMRVVAARRDSPLSLPEPISESDDDVTVDRAVGTIEDILKKYRIKGLDAYVVITPDGRILVVVGTPPNSEAELAAALEGARMLLGEPTLKE